MLAESIGKRRDGVAPGSSRSLDPRSVNTPFWSIRRSEFHTGLTAIVLKPRPLIHPLINLSRNFRGSDPARCAGPEGECSPGTKKRDATGSSSAT
jgi:hypothetical protein